MMIRIFPLSGHQFLILVGIAAVFLIIIIIAVTVAIWKLIDKSKKRQRQLNADNTQAYYAGSQMTMRPMYTQQRAASQVPDILENSLPRHAHAPSESSYGTNYPGTMYYMGHNQHALRVDYDCVTLPKKPETVSDSDSDDMYATIPADDEFIR